MADSITFKIEGIEGFSKSLDGLPNRIRKRVVFTALRAGGRLMLKGARNKAPKGRTGNLRKAIILRNSRIHNGRRGKRLLGVYLGLKNFSKVKAGTKNNAYYARFVHEGYNVKGEGKSSGRPPRGRKTNRGRSNVRGRKFIKRAFDSRSSAATNLILRTADKINQQVISQLGL